MTVVTTVLLFLLQYSLRRLAEGESPFSFGPFSETNFVEHTKHEKKILESVVDASKIEERMVSIGGLKSTKADIEAQVLLPLQYPKVFFGDVVSLHPPRGVLLYGPPGTGKTMLARAIAAEAKCPFIAITLSSLEDKWFGESSKLLAAAFSVASKMQPCVLFIDEIDGFMRKRNELENEATYGMKTEFLQRMDGISSSKKDAFIVIACTNCKSLLDPAVLRRLPQQFEVALPDADEVTDILRVHLQNSGLSENAIQLFSASLRKGVSGSDICELVRFAWSIGRRQLLTSAAFLKQLESGSVDASAIRKTTGKMRLAHLLEAAKSRQLLRDP